MNTDAIRRARELLHDADAAVVGADAGLSTAAGFTYSGEQFRKYFADAEKVYGFHDIFSIPIPPWQESGLKQAWGISCAI